MYYYVAFSAMFFLYAMDVVFYSVVALMAKACEVLRPEVGSPWYARRHGPEQLVPLPPCDARGFVLQPKLYGCDSMCGRGSRHQPDRDAARDGAESERKQLQPASVTALTAMAAGVAADGGTPWQILSGLQPLSSGAGSSGRSGSLSSSLLPSEGCGSSLTGSSPPNSTSGTCSACGGSNCSLPSSSNSIAGSGSGVVHVGNSSGEVASEDDAGCTCAASPGVHLSAATWPQAQGGMAIHRLRSCMTQLATVYSLPQPGIPPADIIPLAKACDAHCSTQLLSQCTCAEAAVPEPHSRQQKNMMRQGYLSAKCKRVEEWRAGDKLPPDHQHMQPIPEPLTGPPPPSSANLVPGQGVLLPESLVQKYSYFPLVLVQLPMYNEEAHCEVVIERACAMVWPRDRIVVQVCR
jgi:hypothetical protein